MYTRMKGGIYHTRWGYSSFVGPPRDTPPLFKADWMQRVISRYVTSGWLVAAVVMTAPAATHVGLLLLLLLSLSLTPSTTATESLRVYMPACTPPDNTQPTTTTIHSLAHIFLEFTLTARIYARFPLLSFVLYRNISKGWILHVMLSINLWKNQKFIILMGNNYYRQKMMVRVGLRRTVSSKVNYWSDKWCVKLWRVLNSEQWRC